MFFRSQGLLSTIAYKKEGSEMHLLSCVQLLGCISDCILYLLREMKDPSGSFYSSQDADSKGIEGAYYLFVIDEINNILGENDGLAFIKKFGITRKGNFEGKNIPNMLANEKVDENYDFIMNKVYIYRKNRHSILTDDKIITSRNCLLISALSTAYKYSFNKDYLSAAKNAFNFIIGNLAEGKNVYTFFRKGKKSANGFLDDYAALIYACISLYGATLDSSYLDKAEFFLEETVKEFFDNEKGGFYLNKKSENNLIRRPNYQEVFAKLKKYLDDTFTPGGQSFYAYSSIIGENFSKLVAATKTVDDLKILADKPEIFEYDIIFATNPTDNYSLKNDKTTFYVCKNNSCLPPSNVLT
ncbi:thioredoxin domain-containing protein [bacterium]|nr:thioredoxin domain-containing protein [bacterium]